MGKDHFDDYDENLKKDIRKVDLIHYLLSALLMISIAIYLLVHKW